MATVIVLMFFIVRPSFHPECADTKHGPSGPILRLRVSVRFDNPFLTCGYVERPRTMARTSGPNCSSLGAPMPGIATSAALSARSCSAIAIRVLSVKTTNAGTVIAVAVAANTAKLEGVGVHALRHSAAMSWLESGVHIKAVADLLGHSS